MTPPSLVIGNPQQMDRVAPGRDFPDSSRYGEDLAQHWCSESPTDIPPVTPSPGMALTPTSGANASNARSWDGPAASAPQAITYPPREVPRCVITVTVTGSEERLGENGMHVPSSPGSVYSIPETQLQRNGTGESVQTPISATSSFGSRNSVWLDTARARRESDSGVYLQESRATSSYSMRTDVVPHWTNGLVYSARVPQRRQDIAYHFDPSTPSLPPLNLGPSIRAGFLPDHPYVLPELKIGLDPDGAWSASILGAIERAAVESDEDNDDVLEPPTDVPGSPLSSSSTMDLPADVRPGPLSRKKGNTGTQEHGGNDHSASSTAIMDLPADLRPEGPSPLGKNGTDASTMGDNHSAMDNNKLPLVLTTPELQVSKPGWKKLVGNLLKRKRHARPGAQRSEPVATAFGEMTVLIVLDKPQETAATEQVDCDDITYIDQASSMSAHSEEYSGRGACCLGKRRSKS